MKIKRLPNHNNRSSTIPLMLIDIPGMKTPIERILLRNYFALVSIAIICVVLFRIDFTTTDFTTTDFTTTDFTTRIALNEAFSTAATSQKQSFYYVALGDSLTAGIGASETNHLRLNAFVPLITSELSNHYDVHVENHGIPGLTTAQLLYYINEGPAVNESLQKADLITISIGGNDLLQLLRQGLLDEQTLQPTMNHFGHLLHETLTTIRSQQPNSPILLLGLYSPYEQGDRLYELGKQTISRFNVELKSQAHQFNNVHVVSVFDDFEDRGHELTHIQRDDIHPNNLGYAVIYKRLQQKLAYTLQE